jgi:hypothetical protein
MYPQHHYLSRSILAMELSEMPENIARRRAYVSLSLTWKKLAEAAAKSAPVAH